MQAIDFHKELLCTVIGSELSGIARRLSSKSWCKPSEEAILDTFFNYDLLNAIYWSFVICGGFAFPLNLQTAFDQFDWREYKAIHETSEASCNNALLKRALLSMPHTHHSLCYFIGCEDYWVDQRYREKRRAHPFIESSKSFVSIGFSYNSSETQCCSPINLHADLNRVKRMSCEYVGKTCAWSTEQVVHKDWVERWVLGSSHVFLIKIKLYLSNKWYLKASTPRTGR